MAASPSAYDVFVSYDQADHAWVAGYLLDALEHAGVTYHTHATFALGMPELVALEQAITSSRRIVLVLSPSYLVSERHQFLDAGPALWRGNEYVARYPHPTPRWA